MARFIFSLVLIAFGLTQMTIMLGGVTAAPFWEFSYLAAAPILGGFMLLLFDSRSLHALESTADWLHEKGPRLSTVVGWLATMFFAGWAISWPTHNAITALVAVAIGSFMLYRSYHDLVVSQVRQIWRHED